MKIAIIFCLINIFSASISQEFNYSNPNYYWPKNFKECGGFRQSPININLDFDSDEVSFIKVDLHFKNYDIDPTKLFVKNNGHTVGLHGNWRNHTPYIHGGPLKGNYIFEQAHFHWGSENHVGSEHTFNHQRYPLEMHLVHWKESYGSFDEAAKHPDGIAVLGHIFEHGHGRNLGLEAIEENFPYIQYSGESSRTFPNPLRFFVVDFYKYGYVTYEGSLTTPPCSESVIWIIPINTKRISSKLLKPFRNLIRLDYGDTKNFRPIQPLNNRLIWYAR